MRNGGCIAKSLGLFNKHLLATSKTFLNEFGREENLLSEILRMVVFYKKESEIQ